MADRHVRANRIIKPSPYYGSDSRDHWDRVGMAIDASLARVNAVMAIMDESREFIASAITKETVKKS